MGDHSTDSPRKNFHLVAAGSADNNLIKAGAGELCGWSIQNCVAALKYVHFYDKATAPVAGTDVPFLTLAIPFGASSAGFSLDKILEEGIAFTNGLGISITTTAADTGSTGVSANDIVANVLYV